MKIIQTVLDKKLLHAAYQAAKRTQRNRSALVRDALREDLRGLELRASEETRPPGLLATVASRRGSAGLKIGGHVAARITRGRKPEAR